MQQSSEKVSHFNVRDNSDDTKHNVIDTFRQDSEIADVRIGEEFQARNIMMPDSKLIPRGFEPSGTKTIANVTKQATIGNIT